MGTALEFHMTLRVGLVGCGQISATYLRLAPLFPGLRMVACADRKHDAAKAVAQAHGLRACSIDELLRDDDIDAVLNLTVPSAHAEVSLAAIAHGRHVFVEKPLATTVQDGRRILDAAAKRGVRVGCAPDTVLGASVQHARQLVASGAIGRVITGCSAVLTRGMEHFHPSPDFFYQAGGGPIFDRAPYDIAVLVTLLGPVRSVMATGQIGQARRRITAPTAARAGQDIEVEVFTTVQGVLTFAEGAQVSFISSWDAWRTEMPTMELHGTEGSMQLPDANWFGGPVSWSPTGGPWQVACTDDAPHGRPNIRRLNGEQAANYRGLGLADMAQAIRDGRPHRAHGEFGLHVLAVMEGILCAATELRRVDIDQPFIRPEPLSACQAASLMVQGDDSQDMS